MKTQSLPPKRLAIALLAGACLAAPVQAQAFGSAHWKSKAQIEGGAQGSMTTESESWLKGGKLRVQTTMMGVKVNVIRSGDFLYQWQENQTTGVKMSASARPRVASADYVDRIEDIRTKGKRIGAETVNGHGCDIYEYTETSEPGRTVKQTYWLAKDLKNFPVKIVAEVGDAKITRTNSDIEIGASVPDAVIALPAGVEFRDMSGK